MSEELARVSASLPRRMFGLSILLVLGGGLIYLALAKPPQSMAWQLFLIAFGAVVLWTAEKMRRATRDVVILTADGLYDSAGQVLAPMEDIRDVERGTFAIKPSNGFVVRLHKKQSRAWAPGLWWRVGRRLGIGGVTSAGQSKFMAETLSVILAEQNL